MNENEMSGMPQDERPMVLGEIEATRARFAEARSAGQALDVAFEVEASVLSLMADMQRQFMAWTDMLAQSQADLVERVGSMESGTQIESEDADVILGFIEDASTLLKELRALVSQKHKDRIDKVLKAGQEALQIVEDAIMGDESDEGEEGDEEDGEE